MDEETDGEENAHTASQLARMCIYLERHEMRQRLTMKAGETCSFFICKPRPLLSFWKLNVECK